MIAEILFSKLLCYTQKILQALSLNLQGVLR